MRRGSADPAASAAAGSAPCPPGDPAPCRCPGSGTGAAAASAASTRGAMRAIWAGVQAEGHPHLAQGGAGAEGDHVAGQRRVPGVARQRVLDDRLARRVVPVAVGGQVEVDVRRVGRARRERNRSKDRRWASGSTAVMPRQ